VQPDMNEPMWRCRHGVNWGFQGMIYRTDSVESLQDRWSPVVFDETKPNCLYLDNALAAISDQVVFYAVPAAQSPGFLREWDGGSERVDMNFQAAGLSSTPWHSCATYGCNPIFKPDFKCQCNEDCERFGDCCHDYQAHCKAPKLSLYCFSFMMANSAEQGLLGLQANRGVGIFACDSTSVFSDTEITLGGGGGRMLRTTWTVEHTHVELSPVDNSPLNTQIFVKVWEKVFDLGLFVENDWTVKADADTVFVPGRLVEHLRPDEEGYPIGRSDSLYVMNCGIGLYSPLEVVSHAAMLRFKSGLSSCVDEGVSDWSTGGEDDFALRCWTHLGVGRLIDFGILDDARCGGAPSPCTSGKVAFHPYRDGNAWTTCLSQVQR